MFYICTASAEVKFIKVDDDEDGGDGKAKEDESAKEGDLPDRDEPGVWLYNHLSVCHEKVTKF